MWNIPVFYITFFKNQEKTERAHGHNEPDEPGTQHIMGWRHDIIEGVFRAQEQ